MFTPINGVITHLHRFMSLDSKLLVYRLCYMLMLSCQFVEILTIYPSFSNFNYAHSNEGASTYADQSGMMGYSYGQDEGPIMCFNAGKLASASIRVDLIDVLAHLLIQGILFLSEILADWLVQ